jgi:hypothetical protein
LRDKHGRAFYGARIWRNVDSDEKIKQSAEGGFPLNDYLLFMIKKIVDPVTKGKIRNVATKKTF